MAINPNDYEFRIWYDPAGLGDEGCFMAQVVEWPHLMADGQTPAEAAQMMREVLEGCLEIAQEQGDPIPPPRRSSTVASTVAAALGRIGGRSKSPAKAAAARRNGKLGAKLGGRPRKKPLGAAA